MKKSQTATAESESPQATYQDVLDTPFHMIAEIVDGSLYTNPRPDSAHAKASSRLWGSIGTPFDFGRGGPGGWWILFEPELHLGEDIVVPDLGGWRRERMPEVPNVAYFTLAPDWVCEVLSPSTRKLDLGGKRMIYPREGVGHIWFIDPTARSLEAFELRSTEYELIDTLYDDAQVSLPPFEAVSFDLGAFWIIPAVQKEIPIAESESELIETSK